MNSKIKKVLSIMCLCGIILSACACYGSVGDENVNTTTASEAVSAVLAEETSKQEDIITVAADTAAESIEKEITVAVIDNLDEIEETDDTKLAKQFAVDFSKSVYLRDTSLIDLDKYVDNIYLKDYLIAQLTIHTDGRGTLIEAGKDWTMNVRVDKVTEREDEGIKYIVVHIFNTTNQRGNEPGGGNTVVGVRDGKVVNVYNELLYQMNFQYLINGETQPWKWTRIEDYQNPWDNEAVAQRAANAAKKYESGEYEFFKDAWNSMGK